MSAIHERKGKDKVDDWKFGWRTATIRRDFTSSLLSLYRLSRFLTFAVLILKVGLLKHVNILNL